MSLMELIVISFSLGMDAFAVSICKGLSIKKISLKYILIISIYFGAFQAFMPAIGYFIGINFYNKIAIINHWIIFTLLSIIGLKMILESIKTQSDTKNDKINFSTMILLAIATSIDALAIGVTFAFLNVNIIFTTFLIGIITFTLSAVGVILGNIFGSKYKKKAEIIGGTILIFMGIKILISHIM